MPGSQQPAELAAALREKKNIKTSTCVQKEMATEAKSAATSEAAMMRPASRAEQGRAAGRPSLAVGLGTQRAGRSWAGTHPTRTCIGGGHAQAHAQRIHRRQHGGIVHLSKG